jgi:hypothetical protein
VAFTACVPMGATVECCGAQAVRINKRGALRDIIRDGFITPFTQKIKAQITPVKLLFFRKLWQSVICYTKSRLEKYSARELIKYI